jgi:hypothetical protein
MENVLNISYRGVALWIATIAASAAITAHITRSNIPRLPTAAEFPRTGSAINTGNEFMAENAAYRDGLFLGKLARSRGEVAHVSLGRWANESDRAAFRVGYRAGYGMSNGNTEADFTEH